MGKIICCPFNTNVDKISTKDIGWTLFESLRKNSDSVAFVDLETGHKCTYKELQRKSELVARHLLNLGCCTGHLLGIFSPNSLEWVILNAAAMRIGVTVVGINYLSTAGELQHHLSISETDFLYATQAVAKTALAACTKLKCTIIVKGGYKDCVAFESLLEDSNFLPELPSFEQLNRKPDDVALIMFSSGTTGRQKAVQLTHRNMQAELVAFRHPEVDIVPAVQLILLPYAHVGGYIWFLNGMIFGSQTLILSRFNFAAYLKGLQDMKVEKIVIVPSIATLLVKSPEVENYQLNHIKSIICGAASLTSNTEDLLLARFPGICIRQVYGLTETTAVTCCVPASDVSKGRRKPGSTGVPLPNFQMKVVDLTNGSSLGAGERGEMCAKSQANTPGYKNNPEATAGLIDKDGWLHTGDIGYYDDDGYFFVVDRLKELIKYNAYQVPPAELDSVLLSHPEVAEACAYGIPDAQAGELPAAWVVLKPKATITESQLQRFVSEKVAPYKKLRGGITFVDAIPKTMSGKHLRRQVRDAAMRAKL